MSIYQFLKNLDDSKTPIFNYSVLDWLMIGLVYKFTGKYMFMQAKQLSKGILEIYFNFEVEDANCGGHIP